MILMIGSPDEEGQDFDHSAIFSPNSTNFWFVSLGSWLPFLKQKKVNNIEFVHR